MIIMQTSKEVSREKEIAKQRHREDRNGKTSLQISSNYREIKRSFLMLSVKSRGDLESDGVIDEHSEVVIANNKVIKTLSDVELGVIKSFQSSGNQDPSCKQVQ